MSRSLTPDSSLDILKKEAKRWLKALRAGDAAARSRLAAALPAVPVVPALRDVQFALAREHGLAGWPALREALEDLALARQSQAELVEIVLRSAWMGDRVAALRILRRWPGLGSYNLPMAIVTGRLDAFRRFLAADPAAATRKTGPLDWEPLLYLAYARLPGGEEHGPAMAQALLDFGADPGAQFDDGWGNPFTVLTGVIGEGEGDRPPHPQARALAALLIGRGASPYDTQALYNTSITRDETGWLDFLWAWSVERGLTPAWLELLEKPVMGGPVPRSTIDYLLGNAVAFNHPRRAAWLLAHGADANGVHAYSGRPLREEALIHGHGKIADLLVRHGASTPPLAGSAAFQAACMRLDREAAGRLAREEPGCLKDASVMLTAARQGRADVVALLLDLGMDVDVADESGQRGLQNAVMGDAMDVVRLLVAHGADIDRPTTRFDGAMGFAAHFGRREIAELLAPHSRDIFNMTYLGMAGRIGELLAEDPALANADNPRYGVTPLFCLPDDEDQALEMTEFLLAHGADPFFRDKKGVSAEEAARKRGLLEVAELMRESRPG